MSTNPTATSILRCTFEGLHLHSASPMGLCELIISALHHIVIIKPYYTFPILAMSTISFGNATKRVTYRSGDKVADASIAVYKTNASERLKGLSFAQGYLVTQDALGTTCYAFTTDPNSVFMTEIYPDVPLGVNPEPHYRTFVSKLLSGQAGLPK